ncbi:uncharacterized protein LOC135497726 [Lineus longissimus]|uniref:uncharacterized protein LOC135497726 n=1 Tax=Lineus longissimus TaxID=88925 RepID=UPI00315DBBA1
MENAKPVGEEKEQLLLRAQMDELLKERKNELTHFLSWIFTHYSLIMDKEKPTTSKGWAKVFGAGGEYGLLTSQDYKTKLHFLFNAKDYSQIQLKCATRIARNVIHKIVRTDAAKVIEKQVDDIQVVRMMPESMDDIDGPMQGKIRYIRGACVAKCLFKLGQSVRRCIGRPTERRVAYTQRSILSQLKVKEQDIFASSEFMDSLEETAFRQGPGRQLVNISDEAFKFFCDLFLLLGRTFSPERYHIFGENLLAIARNTAQENQSLMHKWFTLFDFITPHDEAEDEGMEDMFLVTLNDLYYSISYHFTRIMFKEMLFLLKEDLPRKKKQALCFRWVQRLDHKKDQPTLKATDVTELQKEVCRIIRAGEICQNEEPPPPLSSAFERPDK